jgi:peroxiredoxin
MTSYVAEVLHAPYPILSDASWEVFHRYGMGSGMGIPLPGSFVLDAEGVIRYAWAAPFSVTFTPPAAELLLRVVDSL